MATSTRLVPDHRPRMDAAEVRAVIAEMAATTPGVNGDALLERCPVRLFGVRGYFRNTLGRKGVNDLGYYDDAIAIVTETELITFNANADPVKAGFNPGVGKLFAQLRAPQIVVFRQGPHRGKPNHLRQLTDEEAEFARLDELFTDDRRFGEFEVLRVTADGRGEVESAYQAINVHAGSERGTSSWGCQTIVPEQHPEFQAAVYTRMNARGQGWSRGYGVIPYFFTDRRMR